MMSITEKSGLCVQTMDTKMTPNKSSGRKTTAARITNTNFTAPPDARMNLTPFAAAAFVVAHIVGSYNGCPGHIRVFSFSLFSFVA